MSVLMGARQRLTRQRLMAQLSTSEKVFFFHSFYCLFSVDVIPLVENLTGGAGVR
jgi:hypothetical protein